MVKQIRTNYEVVPPPLSVKPSNASPNVQGKRSSGGALFLPLIAQLKITQSVQSGLIRAAVDVKAVLLTSGSDAVEHALDVVIIIDNSKHTSPATLMANCEAAEFLVLQLRESIDRVAILCTGQEEVMPLSDPQLKVVRKSLEKIGTNAIRMTRDSMSQILLEAEAMIGKMGHVVLFTNYVPSHCNLVCDYPLHVISAGPLPERPDEWPLHIGFRLRSQTGRKPPEAKKARQPEQPDELYEDISHLIELAHHGLRKCHLGHLTEPQLLLEAGDAYTVTRVLGPDRVPVLLPGETYSVVVEIRPATPDDRITEMIQEVEMMVKDILTAQLIYHSPNLPNQTGCMTRETCSLHDQKTVHRRLAYIFFSQSDGRVSVNDIEGVLPEFTEQLAIEQRFCQRLAERQRIARSPRKGQTYRPTRSVPSEQENASKQEQRCSMRSTSHKPPDAARRIWTGMRLASGSNHRRFTCPATLQEDLWQQAIRNQRSIGAESLRSLSLNSGPKMITPWL